MPRASTPRSARQARTAADPLLRKPQVVIQTVPRKNVVAKVSPVQKPPKPTDSISSSKKWVASPVPTTPAGPDKDTPWRHPAELEYITPPLSDDEIISILIKNGFSVPPRPRASKDPWTKITSWDGQTVTTIPRLYRLPLMFAAKFQWQSLKLVMASENREKEWEEYKYDILHVSRLCTKFLEEAREAKTQLLLNKEWKCHTFDRAIIRYYQKWMLSRDEFVKEFWYEFDEDEYRKNVFELNWHKFVLEGHKGFNLTKEEIMNGLTFEDFTEGCGFVDGRVKWGTSSSTASATAEQENVLGSSGLSPSSNGVSSDPIGRLRPRIDKLSLEIKREMLDDSISVSSTSSSLSPAPSSPFFSPADRLLRVANEDHEYDADRTLTYPGSIHNAHSQSPATSPSTLTAVTNTQSQATSTDLSSVPSPRSYSVDGTPPVDKDVPMADPVLPTPPPSAPSAPPALSTGVIRRPRDESQIPSTTGAASCPPLADSEQSVAAIESTTLPQHPPPLVVQTVVNGAAESPASSSTLGGSIVSPIQNSFDASVSAELATSNSADSPLASSTTPLSTPSSTPAVPPLPDSLRRMSPAAVTPPPALDPDTSSKTPKNESPPEYNDSEKELLQTYFQFPGTPAPPEAPQSTDLPTSAIPDVAETGKAALGEKEYAEEMDTLVQSGDEPAFESSFEPSVVVSPKPSLLEKPTSPSSFDISSSRASSADRADSPNMDISPPPSARLENDRSPTRPRSSSDSMDLDNPLAEKVTTVLKHTVKGLTELMNSVHPGPTRSSDMTNGADAIASSSNSSASLSEEPSLADLMGEIRSLRQVIQEESKQKADRDAELRQLKLEMEELRKMLIRSSDDSMSIDSDPPGSRVLHSASYYRRSPSIMTPISAHPLSHLVHAEEEPATNNRPGHQRSASGSTMGGGESISTATRVPSRPTHSASPSKSLQSPVPENVPFKLKKKHMVFPKAQE